jgi:hypothetical protein
VYVVAPLIKKTATERAVDRAKHAAETAREIARKTPSALATAYRAATDPETLEKVRADATIVRDLVTGKAMDSFRPLLERLMGKAIFENNSELGTTTYQPAREVIAAE